jgi:hypothetical protein
MFRQIRATTVVSHPSRLSISSATVRCSRSHASWTASSASLREPRVRYATLYRRALTAALEIGAAEMLADALSGVAFCEVRAGNPVVAARLLGQSNALVSSLGSPYHAKEEERARATMHAALGPDGLAAELAAGAAMSVEDAVDLAFGRADSAASADA